MFDIALETIKEYAQQILEIERETGIASENHLIYDIEDALEVLSARGFSLSRCGQSVSMYVVIQGPGTVWGKTVEVPRERFTEEQLRARANAVADLERQSEARAAAAREEQDLQMLKKLKAKYEPLAQQLAAAITEVWRGVKQVDPIVVDGKVYVLGRLRADAEVDTLKDVFERELQSRAEYLE